MEKSAVESKLALSLHELNGPGAALGNEDGVSRDSGQSDWGAMSSND